MRKRHWVGVFLFVLAVILPSAAAIYYLWNHAEDQYVSEAGFVVRSEQGGDSASLLQGLAQLGRPGVTSETDVLHAFIQSADLVSSVDQQLDLRGHYSAYYDTDPVFSVEPDATIEDLTDYWARVVRLAYDSSTGLIEVSVSAFDPDYAQKVNVAILDASQRMINQLNEQARSDAMRYAVEDLEQTVARLKAAREALTQFRSRTQIVDPQADIQSRMGVLTNLQQQLAGSLIEYDLLQLNTRPGDPRLRQARQEIDAIRNRISTERQTLSSDIDEPGGIGEDYPKLIAEYESLQVDLLFAEETYRAALASVEVARAEAQRQSMYLATYIRPTLPQSSQAPRRELLAALVAGFALLTWAIVALIYYSIRDRG